MSIKDQHDLAGLLKIGQVVGLALREMSAQVCAGVTTGELDAIGKYNASIKLAQELGDNGTRELLDKILKMEEKHVDWGEEQRDQIAQMGIANYLAIQAAGEDEKG